MKPLNFKPGDKIIYLNSNNKYEKAIVKVCNEYRFEVILNGSTLSLQWKHLNPLANFMLVTELTEGLYVE